MFSRKRNIFRAAATNMCNRRGDAIHKYDYRSEYLPINLSDNLGMLSGDIY